MAYGFDPSIILATARPEVPTPNETLQTLAQLATHRASLADMLRKQQQEQTLASIFKARAGTAQGLVADLMRAGLPREAMAWQDQEAQMAEKEAAGRKSRLETETAYRRYIGEKFSSVKDQAGLDAARQELMSSGDPLLATYVKTQVPETYTAESIKPIADQAISPEKRASIEAMAGRGPIVINEDGTMMRASGTTATPLQDDRGNPVKARPKGSGGGGAGGGGEGVDLSPAALDAMASQYAATGQLPTGLGMGKGAAAIRTRIANRAAELSPDADLAGAKASYGANSKSLAKQQQQADAMNAFEETALANLDTFLEQARKVVDPGSPLFNAPARKFADTVRGDPKMAAFNAARQTAVQEIGKVLSGSLGNAAISDSARHEVESLLSKDASLAQLEEAAKVLKRDMSNRRKAVDAQLAETRGRISGKKAATEGGTGAKSVTKREYSKSRNQTRLTYSDGTQEVVDGRR